jgi:hypothetical protein
MFGNVTTFPMIIKEHVFVFCHRRKPQKAGVLTQELLPFPAKWR